MAQVDETLLTQKTSPPPLRRPIDSDLLLLDSQSTVHLFSCPEHVNNIRPATNPIRDHCNKGVLETTTEADFGQTPVYFYSHGVANVLSLYRFGQKFCVTYDSDDQGRMFQVWTDKGVIKFTPTSKGLQALNLKDNPDAAFLLVNNAADAPQHSSFTTVRHNYEGFT